MGQDKTIPEAIRKAINVVRTHPSHIRTIEEASFLDPNSIKIVEEFEVPLPSMSKKRGESVTKVRDKEAVVFIFPQSFPFKSPKIWLRRDFNRELPHIYPGSAEEYVRPCIYEGILDELLHQGYGLNEIIDQLVEWLSKAARNDLIDPKQGWEPIRRDDIDGSVEFDLDKMRSLATRAYGAAEFACEYYFFDSPRSFFMGRVLDKIDSPLTFFQLHPFHQLVSLKKYGPGIIGKSIAIFSWGNQLDTEGREITIGKYFPETVMNYQQLLQRAQEYGCVRTLSIRLNRVINTCNSKPDLFPNYFFIVIILCARRPYNLIQDVSSLELIPYLVKIEPNTDPMKWAVRPLSHHQVINPKLLKKMSGNPFSKENAGIIQFGCGSLGSKISLHLARSGYGPFTLIDRSNFSPHNASRHALYEVEAISAKAGAMEKAIKSLNVVAKGIQADIIEYILNVQNKKGTLPKHALLIIDSTASLAVREFLASLPPNVLYGTLMHTALYSSGEVGIIMIEGAGRNPRLDDLYGDLFSHALRDESLRKALISPLGMVSRQMVGQGCGSYTMIMPDTRVSAFATSMAERASQILDTHSPEAGEIWIGEFSKNLLGPQWRQLVVEKVRLIDSPEMSWNIRVLHQATESIRADIDKYELVETGGLLIGKVWLARRCVTITNILDAPPDSIRQRNSFILGITGLRKKVEEIHSASGGLLSYLGTWHSHLTGEGPSPTDYDSLQRMKELRLGAPTINLVFTPNSVFALTDDGDA